ncbi:MAG: alpha-hydroxy-acid oxidizing protein, partial [Vicinamibacterales bacterium]
TLRANREGFDRYQLKTRRFVDVRRIDMSLELVGSKFNSPVVLSPIGSSRRLRPPVSSTLAGAGKPLRAPASAYKRRTWLPAGTEEPGPSPG